MRRTLAVVLLALAVLAAAATLPGCGLQDQAVENTSGKIDVAKDAAAKAQLMMIKTGVQAYIATNGSVPADASQATLGSFVTPWPVEPVHQAADDGRETRRATTSTRRAPAPRTPSPSTSRTAARTRRRERRDLAHAV